MTDEVKAYFLERYKKAKFRVVPGHWPDFDSKEDVDQWIRFGESLSGLSSLKGKERLPDDGDDF